jgi:hypothetical protein
VDGFPRAVVPEPVTESLVVHWRPTIQYHERRVELLTQLRAASVLEEWRVTPNSVGARTPAAQITMDEDGVYLHPRRSLLHDPALDLLRRAFDCVAPPSYHFTAAFQFLIPIRDRSYDEARAELLARVSLAPLMARDFAILLDGSLAGDKWTCEFGVIAEPEVESRVRRWVGRMGDQAGVLPPYVPIPDEVAPASLFIDISWLVPEREGRGPESVNDIAKKVGSLIDHTAETVAALQSLADQNELDPVAGES